MVSVILTIHVIQTCCLQPSGPEISNLDQPDEAQERRFPKDFATQQAGLWRKGLADYRRQGYKAVESRGADAIYTPGSNASCRSHLNCSPPRRRKSQNPRLFRNA
jgi:hypothetical protein